MIDERFSSSQFAARGWNSPASDALARELAGAIADELQSEMRVLAARIAAKLNELGHALTETEFDLDDEDGAVGCHYHDLNRGSDRSDVQLRFGLDLTISSGFPGYRDLR